jgi:hypothetical protein
LPAEEDRMHEHLHALAIHAFYAGEIDTGRRASDRLLNMPLPADLERQARANRTWYTPLLAELAHHEAQRIEVEPAHPGWSTFNPTIIPDGTGLLAIVRSSNYRIDDAGRYVIPPEDDGAIRTENILCRIDKHGHAYDAKVIVPPAYEPNGFAVHGLEDCRLRRTAGGVSVSATVRDAAPWMGQCRIGVADLDVSEARLHGLRVLEWEGLGVHEKNWMPIDGRDGWLYAANHGGQTVTVTADDDMPGVYEVAGRGAAPHLAAGFRGGGQLVPVRDGWLAVVHEVAYMDDGRRAYEHRFVWFDASFTLRRWSPLFSFLRTKSIEFAAGLAAIDGRIVVSFGVNDAEAWTATLAEEDVCELLAPVS